MEKRNELVAFYQNLGWTIFPVRVFMEKDDQGNPKRFKKPLCRFSEYFKNPPASQQIEDWFEKKIFWGKPQAVPDEELYIGLITGKTSGMTVVDVDPRNGGDQNIFNDIETMQSKTPSGGSHFFFLYDERLKQAQKGFKDYPGVDVRNDGGFVILPSGHEDYEWIKPPESYYLHLASIPSFLIDNQLNGLQKGEREYKDYSAVFNGEKEVVQGERHDYLRDYIWRMLNTYNPQGKDLPGFLEMALALNARMKPPKQREEVIKLFNYSVDRLLRSAIYRMSVLSAVKTEKSLIFDEENPKKLRTGVNALKNDENVPNPYKPIDICDLSANQGEKEWIWEGFIAKNHITLFSALWKAGKSTFITHLLRSLQKDGEFPTTKDGSYLEKGYKTKKSKVLILSEESEYLWAERRDDLGIVSRETAWIICRPLKQRLNYKGWVDLLEQEGAFCKEQGIDLFVIDTISGFWNVANENDAADVGSALIALNNVINKKTAVLLVHHFRKSGGEDAVAARGSGALGAYVDIIVDFTRMQGESNSSERVLKMYSRFRETPNELVVELDLGEDVYYLKSDKVSDVMKDKRLERVYNELLTFKEGVTIPEFQELWGGEKISVRSMRRYFKELEEKAKIFIVGEKLSGSRKTPLWSCYPAQNEDKPDTALDNGQNDGKLPF